MGTGMAINETVVGWVLDSIKTYEVLPRSSDQKERHHVEEDIGSSQTPDGAGFFPITHINQLSSPSIFAELRNRGETKDEIGDEESFIIAVNCTLTPSEC